MWIIYYADRLQKNHSYNIMVIDCRLVLLPVKGSAALLIKTNRGVIHQQETSRTSLGTTRKPSSSQTTL